MAPNQIVTESLLRSSRARLGVFLYLAVFIALLVPSIAFGAESDTSGGVLAATCGVATGVNNILNAISVIVVTIAVIFSGYQIAFAHKRIGDVAPVLIGGILIGAAGQIANMFLRSQGSGGCPTSSLMNHAMDHYAVVMHLLQHYA